MSGLSARFSLVVRFLLVRRRLAASVAGAVGLAVYMAATKDTVNWPHVWSRFVVHVFSGTTVYVLAALAVHFALFRWPEVASRIIPALLALGFIGWREVWDVGKDGLIKSIFDWVGWGVGLGAGVYLVILANRYLAVKKN